MVVPTVMESEKSPTVRKMTTTTMAGPDDAVEEAMGERDGLEWMRDRFLLPVDRGQGAGGLSRAH